jgi:hypothetical protein
MIYLKRWSLLNIVLKEDTTHIDASQRPSNKEYNHYLHIIEIAKEHITMIKKIAELSRFLQDPL